VDFLRIDWNRLVEELRLWKQLQKYMAINNIAEIKL
jgi:hypothetical protein